MRWVKFQLTKTLLISFLSLGTAASLLMGCAPTPTPQAVTQAQPTQTAPDLFILPSPTVATATRQPSQTVTPGPSPTSTVLPPLTALTWQAAPIMVAAAHLSNDPLDPFQYTPLFVLYGDGLLVRRVCREGDCQYNQTQLDEESLCRLVNSIDRSGFLSADPAAITLSGGTGAAIQLSVALQTENQALIPDLDRWAESEDWYTGEVGCAGCGAAPQIDPAFIDLYRLLTTYDSPTWSGLETERLALWISDPVIVGAPQTWPPDLIPLNELAARSTCPNDPSAQQAVILEAKTARAAADFLSSQSVPLYEENGQVWQVQSRWLLPYEMPQSCQRPAALYPPSVYPGIVWACLPEMGAIPTPTATITPSPTVTRTPLR